MAQDKRAELGDTVRFHYTGRTEDGSTVLSSDGGHPTSATLGRGNVIEGVEDAIVGMRPGEHKRILVPAEKAFGPRYEERTGQVKPSQIPVEPTVGREVRVQTGAGSSFLATITDVTDDTVLLDANHPLAGHDLTFDIDLLEVL
jgi:peptidylprolyl isomerase